MSQKVRVEIKSRDEFWSKAVHVEWGYRYPDRELTMDADGWYLVDDDWLESLKEVATECNSSVVVGPTNPGRRSLFQKFMPSSREATNR